MFLFSNAKQNQYLAFDFPNTNNPKFNTVKFSTPAQIWKQEVILKVAVVLVLFIPHNFIQFYKFHY